MAPTSTVMAMISRYCQARKPTGCMLCSHTMPMAATAARFVDHARSAVLPPGWVYGAGVGALRADRL